MEYLGIFSKILGLHITKKRVYFTDVDLGAEWFSLNKKIEMWCFWAKSICPKRPS